MISGMSALFMCRNCLRAKRTRKTDSTQTFDQNTIFMCFYCGFGRPIRGFNRPNLVGWAALTRGQQGIGGDSRGGRMARGPRRGSPHGDEWHRVSLARVSGVATRGAQRECPSVLSARRVSRAIRALVRRACSVDSSARIPSSMLWFV